MRRMLSFFISTCILLFSTNFSLSSADFSIDEVYQQTVQNLNEIDSRLLEIQDRNGELTKVKVSLYEGGRTLFNEDKVLIWEYYNRDTEELQTRRFSFADKLIVSVTEEAGDINNVVSTLGINEAQLRPILFSDLYVVEMSNETASDAINAIDLIQSHPLIERAEPDWIQFTTQVPNDPRYPQQYAYPIINAPDAWDVTTGDASIVVGVIDTGIAYTHPDLQGQIYSNPGETGFDANGNNKASNGVDDDNNGLVDDWQGWDFYNKDNDPNDINGHGTHVAGTIAARTNNSVGVSGTAWQARLLPLKFLGGVNGSGSTEDAISAVEYAELMGVKITNNSWGGGGASSFLLDAIESAGRSGSIFVAAAGNRGVNTDNIPHYPSSYDSNYIISVLASNSSDSLASFSNYGLLSTDIAAPGVSILSSHLNDGYRSLNGTSMAAPHVAGAAALVLAKDPHLNPLQVKARILSGGTEINNMIGKSVTGSRLDVFSALTPKLDSSHPVGSLLPFYGDVHFLSENWVLSDGSKITDPDSPLYGRYTPDMRSRFLMGSPNGRTGELGGSALNQHSHQFSGTSRSVWFPRKSGNGHSGGYAPANRAGSFDERYMNIRTTKNAANPFDSHGHMNGVARISGVTGTATSDNRPPFLTVNYIIRIK